MAITSTGENLGRGASYRSKKLANLDLTPAINTWVRNPEWLPMPAVTPAEQKVVILTAVQRQLNFTSMLGTGGYVVDWGDGSVIEYGTGVKATYQHDYTSPALAGTDSPVTIDSVTNTVNRTAHGYANGAIVTMYSIVGPTIIQNGQQLYVVNATADTFQVALSQGGAAILLGISGTAALLPYKQALITITPTAGQNLLTLSLEQVPANHVTGVQPAGYLDMIVSGPMFGTTGLTLSSTIPTTPKPMLARVQVIATGAMTVLNGTQLTGLRQITITPDSNLTQIILNTCSRLETFEYLGAALTSMSSMFSQCSSLKRVNIPNTGLVTNMSAAFNSCRSLEIAPVLNTQSVTNASSMFSSCGKLRAAPAYNFPVANSISSLFSSCSELIEAPDIKLGLGVAINGMFASCTGLKRARLTGLGTATSFTTMFSGCTTLEEVSIKNMGAVTTADQMFNNCGTLRSVELVNAASLSIASSMFSNCTSLKGVVITGNPPLTSMTSTFSGCSSLVEAPELDTSAVTTFNTTFNGCSSLVKAPNWDLSAAPAVDTMFGGCRNLEEVPKYTLRAAGVTASNMFGNCISLREIPFDNTALVTSFSGIFSGCAALLVVPPINHNAISTSPCDACFSLQDFQITGMRNSFALQGCRIPIPRLEAIMESLAPANSTASFSILQASAIREAGGTQIKVGTGLTIRSRTMTLANTTGLSAGMSCFSGVAVFAINTSTTFTADVSTDTLTLTGHAIPNNIAVWFTSIGTVTGIALKQKYYTVNTTANTLQLSLTLGGAAVDLTGTNASVALRYVSHIESVDSGTSITLTAPLAATSASVSVAFVPIDITEAYTKGWTMSI